MKSFRSNELAMQLGILGGVVTELQESKKLAFLFRHSFPSQDPLGSTSLQLLGPISLTFCPVTRLTCMGIAVCSSGSRHTKPENATALSLRLLWSYAKLETSHRRLLEAGTHEARQRLRRGAPELAGTLTADTTFLVGFPNTFLSS